MMPLKASGSSPGATATCFTSSFGSFSSTFAKGEIRTVLKLGAMRPLRSANTPNLNLPDCGRLKVCAMSPDASPMNFTSSDSPALPPGGNTALGRGKLPMWTR